MRKRWRRRRSRTWKREGKTCRRSRIWQNGGRICFSRFNETEKAPKLHVVRYTADQPKGVLVISHGFTESAPKYEELAFYFLQAGYHVYLPEHMGHGTSYRMTEDLSMVYVDHWKRYVQELLQVCHAAKSENPELPLS